MVQKHKSIQFHWETRAGDVRDNLQQCAPSWTPFSFLVVCLSGWMNQHQQHVIHYLIEETGFGGSKLATAECVLAMINVAD
jgi:hypothetical protein